MSESVPRWLARVGLVFTILSGVGSARAEPTPDDTALATVLFHEGRALKAAGNISEACLKFAESDRLDPGGGTILNLALCHELEGRLASSWTEFNEALRRARKDGRADREAEALEHARALEPRLSKLTIVVPPEAQVAGLQLERDGREIGRGAWSTAMPVDGGEHLVRATAIGKEPFSTTVVLAQEGDAKTVEIPVLAAPVVVVTPPTFVPQPAAVEAPPSPSARPLRWVAIGTAGAGVIALGTAGYVLSTALAKKADAKPHCDGDICSDPGLQLRHDAVSRGNTATILGVSGLVLAGAGVTLFWLESRSHASAESTARLVVRPGGDAVMATIEGAF